jgi:uncharacterized membrane protein YbhN (UPF0104 family)
MRYVGRVFVVSVSIAVAASCLLVMLPHITGVGWDDTADRIGVVSPDQLTVLVIVWWAGLTAHTLVLRGALPGLSVSRAWALNLGGSSVSNVLPMGGAAGVGLNYAMLRSWGYSRTEIATFAVVTNAIVAAVKASIGIVGLVIVLQTPALSGTLAPHLDHALPDITAASALLLLVGLLARGSVTNRAKTGWHAVVQHFRLTLRSTWPSVLIGGLAYPFLQVLMLGMCLHVLGARASAMAVLAAYAVERLATVIPLTPGGVGIAETSATATLVAFGVAAPAAAAGVVLFRIFSYLIEIPVGGVIAAVWMAGRRGQLAEHRRSCA